MKLKRDKYLVEEEYKALLGAARLRRHKHAVRDYAMLAVGGLAGLRAKEIAGLRHGDLGRIEERPAFLCVTRAKKRKFVQEDVALPVHAALALLKYVRTLPQTERQPWLRVFPLSTRQIGRLFKTYARRARLNPNYSAHALRHYRGVSLYESTKDINLVKESLGHSDIRYTQVYIHTVEQATRAAAVDVDLPPP